MLSDMKIFKQLLRKSLNLIQGMEMMNQVNLSSIFTILELYPLSSRAICKQLVVLVVVVDMVSLIIISRSIAGNFQHLVFSRT